MAGERQTVTLQAMTFRRKLLILSALTVFFSVAAVGYLVSFVAGKAFRQTEEFFSS